MWRAQVSRAAVHTCWHPARQSRRVMATTTERLKSASRVRGGSPLTATLTSNDVAAEQPTHAPRHAPPEANALTARWHSDQIDLVPKHLSNGDAEKDTPN
ncbi:hypothetical protein HPB50_005443 [Hyalomma asiaticum]|uniref:Uncharacterized protein n=1 Tax=Hyalomma asiaticum TaxID=266040 RepID=A0ACB7SVA7_HYAAI|nr:hypothetical protein HPB50_005443 [Hyalomma asiaticum]